MTVIIKLKLDDKTYNGKLNSNATDDDIVNKIRSMLRRWDGMPVLRIIKANHTDCKDILSYDLECMRHNKASVDIFLRSVRHGETYAKATTICR